MQIFPTRVHAHSCVTPQGGVRVRDWRWRSGGSGGVGAIKQKAVVQMSCQTVALWWISPAAAAACSCSAAFSPLSSPTFVCRLTLWAAITEGFICLFFYATLLLPWDLSPRFPSPLYNSLPFRRLQRGMTRAIVLMEACICSLPVLRHLCCLSPPLRLSVHVCSRQRWKGQPWLHCTFFFHSLASPTTYSQVKLMYIKIRNFTCSSMVIYTEQLD